MSQLLEPLLTQEQRDECARNDAAIQADLAEDVNKAQRRREVQDQATAEAEAVYFRSRGLM